jgi:hypothetical protein
VGHGISICLWCALIIGDVQYRADKIGWVVAVRLEEDVPLVRELDNLLVCLRIVLQKDFELLSKDVYLSSKRELLDVIERGVKLVLKSRRSPIVLCFQIETFIVLQWLGFGFVLGNLLWLMLKVAVIDANDRLPLSLLAFLCVFLHQIVYPDLSSVFFLVFQD